MALPVADSQPVALPVNFKVQAQFKSTTSKIHQIELQVVVGPSLPCDTAVGCCAGDGRYVHTSPAVDTPFPLSLLLWLQRAAYLVADTVSVLAGHLCGLWREQGGRPKTNALS
jgi:hypothetical protein